VSGGGHARRRAPENHEAGFMMPLIRRIAHREDYGPVTIYRSLDMTWETPQAVELRFGMEITMYVLNR
jgi:coenzyme PQQ precursor peptide PqqA